MSNKPFEIETLRFSDGTIQTTAYTVPQQRGYFAQLTHSGDNNRAPGEAVVIDADNNSYVSYSYYDENLDKQLGGIVKFNSSGEQVWSRNIQSATSNSYAVEIASLELVETEISTMLMALGTYYDNVQNLSQGVMYYISTEDGTIVTGPTSEFGSYGGVVLRDGVSNGNGAVVVGYTYNEIIPKTIAPIAPSGVDRLYITWENFTATGLAAGEQLVYNTGNYYGVTLNSADVVATPDGTGNNGIYLNVRTTQAGEYVIVRSNGYSDLSGWTVPISLRVRGSTLGGVDRSVTPFTPDSVQQGSGIVVFYFLVSTYPTMDQQVQDGMAVAGTGMPPGSIVTNFQNISGSVWRFDVAGEFTLNGDVIVESSGNDLTFDFDRTAFYSTGLSAAVSNISGTPISDVFCTGFNGHNWGTDVGGGSASLGTIDVSTMVQGTVVSYGFGSSPPYDTPLGAQSDNIFTTIVSQFNSDTSQGNTIIFLNDGTYGNVTVSGGAVNGDIEGTSRDFTVGGITVSMDCMAGPPGQVIYRSTNYYAFSLSTKSGQTLAVSVGGFGSSTVTMEYHLNEQAYIAQMGEVTWAKNLGAQDSERINSVVQDNSGGVYVVGQYYDPLSNKGGLVAKYDSEGSSQWAVRVDADNNVGVEIFSIDLLADGNIITVGDDGLVTKLDSGSGSIIWQVSIGGGISWASDFKGTATPAGDYIFTNYEDNDYTLYVMRLSGVDGSVMWSKQISRAFGPVTGEIYPQDDFQAQYIDCNSEYVTIAASTSIYLNNNSMYAGLVITLPIDGENIDGTYGEYIISAVDLTWVTETTTSTAATLAEQSATVESGSATPTSAPSDIVVARTVVGDAVTAGVNTGDITFSGVEIRGAVTNGNYGAIKLVPNSDVAYIDAGQFLAIYPTTNQDAPHIHIAAGITNGNTGDLILGSDTYNLDVNHDGTVRINTNGSTQWKFDDTGALTLPMGSEGPGGPGFIQIADGYPTLLAYGAGDHGGPELDWADTDNLNGLYNNNTVLRHTMYLNNTGLYIGMNENNKANVFSGAWQFDTNGVLTLPDDVVLGNNSITSPLDEDFTIVVQSTGMSSPPGPISRTVTFGANGTVTVPYVVQSNGNLLLKSTSQYGSVDLESSGGPIGIGYQAIPVDIYIGYSGGGNRTRLESDRLQIFSNPPTSSIGITGDEFGMVAFNESYIYYCTSAYDGVTNIWRRVAWSGDTW